MLRQRVNIQTNGATRNILVINESAKGDVYIRIKSGTQVGIPPNEIRVIQDRYSIHPTPNSPDFTMLKSTFELASGHKQTTVAMTDAVKLRTGFSHVFSHRSSDLAAAVYDPKDDGSEILDLGNFDPRQGALIIAVFVGHPESGFPLTSPLAVINTLRSQSFQIVLCHAWVNLGALPFAWTMNSLTTPPELHEDPLGQEAARLKMTGRSPQSCLELFSDLANELLVNLLETYQSLSDDDEYKKSLQRSIDQVPRIPSIRL